MFVPLLVTDFIKRASKHYPRKVGIVDGKRRITYSEFGERVNRLSNALVSLGIQKGDKVAVVDTNSHRYLEQYYGIPQIGAILLPINIRLTAKDILYILSDSEAKCLLLNEDLANLVDKSQLRYLDRLVLMRDGLPKGDLDIKGPEYEEILDRIRGAKVLYVDETSIRVQGKKYWIWAFTTPTETFVVIRKSRGMKVLMEILTRRFTGIIVCDGWKPYAKFTNHIQRCWAHLLRESEYLAEKIAEAAPLDKALRRLYRKLNDALESDPPPETRRQLWYMARAALRRWIRREYASEKVEKFIGKISNGFEYWFTFVLRSDVEPTNNRAERALREHVVQRKIIGTLRNEKGTSIHERIMTVLTTWAQQGLNSFQMLRSKLSG